MKTGTEQSIRRHANDLFVNTDGVDQKYSQFLAFCNRVCPSNLWERLRGLRPASDIRGLAKWAETIKPKTLKNAKRVAFHLTHPSSNAYGIECCHYTTESFDNPMLLGNQGAISEFAGLAECGHIIGIDREDEPTPDVELADRFVPLVYACLILAEWMRVDTGWLGGSGCAVYVVNFGAEAIPIGIFNNGKFDRTAGPLFCRE